MLKKAPHYIREFFLILGPFKMGFATLCGLMGLTALFEGVGLILILPLLSITLGSSSNDFWSTTIKKYFISYLPADKQFLSLCIIIVFVFLAKGILVLVRTAYSTHYTYGLWSYWSSLSMNRFLYGDYLNAIGQKQGHLINNIVFEPKNASKFVEIIVNFLINFSLALAFYSILIIAHPQATLIITVFLLGLFLLTRTTVNHYALKVGKKRIKFTQQTTSIAAETTTSIKQVKAFGLEDKIDSRFNFTLKKMVKMEVIFSVIMASPPVLIEIFSAIFIVFALYALNSISNYSLKDSLPLAGLFLISLKKLNDQFTNLYSGQMKITSNIPSIRIVKHQSQKKFSYENYNTGEEIDKIDTDIVFKNVNFSYPNGTLIFKNFNLQIKYKSLSVITGHSGAGKSTLMDLLLGLVHPDSGAILINNKNLNDLNIISYRKRIAYVSQEVLLFNDSICNNISLNAPNISQEDIETAAKIACAHKFIQSSKNGYQTIVGDRGGNLSGGQRQRLFLARAFARKPDLLILDEAFSALDYKTKNKIFENIQSHCKEMTILIITHDNDILKNVTNVIAIKKQGDLNEVYS